MNKIKNYKFKSIAIICIITLVVGVGATVTLTANW